MPGTARPYGGAICSCRNGMLVAPWVTFAVPPTAVTYSNFREFYPFYLGEHTDRRCRRMHFLGSWLVLASVAVAIATRNAWWLLAAPVCGYACAWVGHFAFEKNRPATFRHPGYSLMGDWAMFVDVLRGRVHL